MQQGWSLKFRLYISSHFTISVILMKFGLIGLIPLFCCFFFYSKTFIILVQAEARFLTLPSIDFNTLTSILLIKAAFLLGNIEQIF